MLEGENIVSAARKAIIRHDFSTVLTVFPILRHLKQTKPEFDQVLQVCVAAPSPGRTPSMAHSCCYRAPQETEKSQPPRCGAWKVLEGGRASRALARATEVYVCMCVCVRASLGHGCQHQEQAAQPHQLHGDSRSESAGGLCRQHQGTCSPSFRDSRPAREWVGNRPDGWTVSHQPLSPRGVLTLACQELVPLWAAVSGS